jgi:hypothetical protein
MPHNVQPDIFCNHEVGRRAFHPKCQGCRRNLTATTQQPTSRQSRSQCSDTLSVVFGTRHNPLNTMSRANGTANGSTKRGANSKPANAQVPMQSTKVGHEKTDYTRWRLKDDRGCQTWHYLKTDEDIKAWPQSKADEYFLGLDTVSHHTDAKPPAYCT